MVVGGWALGLHGWPRATKNIDVWVAVDPDNEDRVKRALDEFHAPGPIADDFFDNSVKNIYFMGLPPTKIEVISAIDGVKFDECYSRAISVSIDEIEIQTMGLEDLKTNKRASGRIRGLADLEDLGESLG